MNIEKIKTLGELKKSGYKHRSVKEEVRENLLKKLHKKENSFPGIVGYEDSVIPDTERALLSRHNILFLGLARSGKNTNGATDDQPAWMNIFLLLQAAKSMMIPSLRFQNSPGNLSGRKEMTLPYPGCTAVIVTVKNWQLRM